MMKKKKLESDWLLTNSMSEWLNGTSEGGCSQSKEGGGPKWPEKRLLKVHTRTDKHTRHQNLLVWLCTVVCPMRKGPTESSRDAERMRRTFGLPNDSHEKFHLAGETNTKWTIHHACTTDYYTLAHLRQIAQNSLTANQLNLLQRGT